MKTLDAPFSYQEIIKKSRFIAHVTRVNSVEEAMAFLEQIREMDASHSCWAYKIGDLYRFSDDGEPGGTAGRPMFMAIEQQDFDHVAAVVVRYFGGIKLGAGGLARAYGGVTGKCLQMARPYHVQNQVIFSLTAPFDKTGIIYTLLDNNPEVQRQSEEYSTEGLVFRLRIVESDFMAFYENAMNVSSGAFQIKQIDTVWE